MKRKITLLFVSLICCIACILSLSACDKSDSANSTKSTEVTALFVSSTFFGSHSIGDNSPYGTVITTDYTFNFISETEVKVKDETTVKYGSLFEGKLDDEYSTSTYTAKYKIKVYNDGTSYIFIEGFGSDGVNVTNDKEAFGKIKFVEKSGEPYSIEAKDFDIINLEIGYPTPNLTDKYAGYHEHIYSTSWSFDSENHWHRCTICNKKELSPHTLTNNKCFICDYNDEIDIFTFYKGNNGYELSGVRDTTRKELIIPASYRGLPVNTIGSEAFSGCSELTSITIPDSVTSIRHRAFSYCCGLTSITIPDSVTSILDSAFSYCSGLTSITIPDSVTYIGDMAFSSCSGLTSITIPDSVTYIGDRAFSWCDSLTNIYIGTNVKSISEYAFQNCPIETATIPALACARIKNKNLKSVIITSGNCISKYALSGCDALTNVIISDSVTSIEEYAFYYCSGLTSIIIPNSVTKINGGAFSECVNLTFYCEAESKPSGWSDGWKLSNCPVVWGYKGD
ncbi:MAG: leucine-rich repeat domain-containing protein [Candidatus Coproplasma sp.]